jgi:hypothetical protein
MVTKICRRMKNCVPNPVTVQSNFLGLLLLTCWDCRFKSCHGHRCLSLVSVVCCKVEVSASGCSLVQKIPTKCSASECVREAAIMRRLWPTRGCCAMEGGETKSVYIIKNTKYVNSAVQCILLQVQLTLRKLWHIMLINQVV